MATTAPHRSKAKLLKVAGNPLPEGGKAGVAVTSDGVHLRYARWSSAIRPSKGTVVILQGRAEFIEKYFETVEDLRQRGFGVLCFDWRGQGGSDRLLADPQKGHVEHFDQYLIDLDTILSDVALPDCVAPFYLLGHSTGGLIALLAAPMLGNRVRRMVLASPLIALRNLPLKQKTLQRALALVSFVGFGRASVDWGGRSLVGRTFVGNNLTSDTRRFDRTGQLLASDPSLALSSPTISWLFAACRAMNQLSDPHFVSAITIPTLLIAAGNDPIVAPGPIEHLGDQMRSGAFHTIFGSKHEILQERDVFREQFLSAFDAFVPGTEV